MNAAVFRRLFNYHFAANRRLWEHILAEASRDILYRPLSYSHGAIHSQLVHMMSVDERWFAGLAGEDTPESLDPADFHDLVALRAHWDRVERKMRAVLGRLTDERLREPYTPGLVVWQVLFHVLNHGTDHRAQVLAMLDGLGVPTYPQDYIFYALDAEA